MVSTNFTVNFIRMSETAIEQIDLFAGERADGTPVMETLALLPLPDNVYQLAKSPGFMRGVAKGDWIKVDPDTKTHTVVRRSGNLCVRVIARDNLESVAAGLVAAMEKLGATLDFQNERMLIFSIHVSCGFQAIEQLLNQHVTAESQNVWFYGNVYTQENGEWVPMNWWQEMLKPV